MASSKYKELKFYQFYKGTKILFKEFKKSFNINALNPLLRIIDFIKDYRSLNQEINPTYDISTRYFTPCLNDKTENTPVEPIYFYQNAWAIGKIVQKNPSHHVDIGSHVPSIGILSTIIPTTFVDIRPIAVKLDNLTFKKGTILNLPFEDKSIESLSSICVIEHIGLGRYGDPIDAFGTEKATQELLRILKPGGNLYITVPIDQTSRIYFNAHRAFTPEAVLKLFEPLKLKEEAYIYDYNLEKKYAPEKGFGTGLYHFCRE